jgi:hypothetical protein
MLDALIRGLIGFLGWHYYNIEIDRVLMSKDKSGLSSRQLRRRRAKKLLFTWSLVLLVVIVIVSAVSYYYVIMLPKEVNPKPIIIDAVGVKATPTDDTLKSVKITIKNNGTGNIDITKISLQFDGPKVHTKLYMSTGSSLSPSKENFGVSGSGEPQDGWDPSNGKFLVRGTTLASLAVDLTAASGINDPLGPQETIKVTITIEEGAGVGNSAVGTFKVPADLGSGSFIGLQVTH